VSPFPPSDHLIALRRNPDHAKSLAATDAPGRRGVGSPINRRRIAVRQLVLRREFCPIHYPPESVQGPLSEARLNAHPYTLLWNYFGQIGYCRNFACFASICALLIR